MRPLFEVYTEVADRFENGHWLRGKYGDIYGGPHCMVGGLNEALMDHRDVFYGMMGMFDQRLPDEIVRDISRVLRRYPSYWLIRPISFAFYPFDRRGRQQDAIEHWNDLSSRRDQYAVAKVLRIVAAKYEGNYWHTKYDELVAERDALKVKLERSEVRRRNLLTRIASERTIATDERELARLNTELDKVAALIG